MAVMTFWIHLAYRLAAVLATLCTLTLGLARAVPGNQSELPFDLCNGIPCVMGVSPGVTMWLYAQQRLSTMPDSQVLPKEIVLFVKHTATAVIYPSINRKAVGRIYINFSTDRAPLVGWIVQRYGFPCGVSVYFDSHLLTLRYPALLVNVRLTHEWLSTATPISSIHFADPNFRSATQPDLCVDNVTSGGMINRPWYGFSSLRFYRDHPTGG
jgi:hypothetical protein